MLVELKDRSQVTIPKAFMEKLKMKRHDYFEVEERSGKLIFSPVTIIPREQEWYLSEEWKDIKKEVDKDIKAGKINQAENVEDLIKKLES